MYEFERIVYNFGELIWNFLSKIVTQEFQILENSIIGLSIRRKFFYLKFPRMISSVCRHNNNSDLLIFFGFHLPSFEEVYSKRPTVQ